MTRASKLTSFALSTYPSWWRERYQDEMVVVIQSLLDDGRSPLRVAINLLASSLRTRLVGTGVPASRRFWVHRTQRSLLAATLPWFAIVPLALTCYLSIGPPRTGPDPFAALTVARLVTSEWRLELWP